MLDLKYLDRLTRERLELLEETSPTFSRCLEIDLTEDFFQMMDERKDKRRQQNLLLSLYGGQGTGKSYAGLFICGYMDKNFSIDNIYFDHNDVVNERYKLKPGTAVLIDEQMTGYGVDSNRIGIILTALKEQLRKLSIHMVLASPVVRSESITSNFCMSTLFLDREYSESYMSLQTPEQQYLGYVVISHPLKVISKKLLLEYEKKKDEHLEQLTTQPIDDVAKRAELIIKDKFFKRAEIVYKEKIGFIPYRNLVQVINMMFPEFKGSVIVYELADRVRFMRELSGDWIVGSQKKKLEAEDRRDGKRIQPQAAATPVKPASVPLPASMKPAKSGKKGLNTS